MERLCHVSSRLFPLCLGLVLQAGAARGGDFQVLPVQIHLGANASSESLALRNRSAETSRFQVSAFEWHQSASGEMELSPTTEVLFFPSMLVLGPGQERKIRVGSTARPGATEKTYRIFVQELPSLELQPNGPPGNVRMLTRMGMPIFVEPERPVRAATIDGLTVASGQLSFEVKNGGNSHFKARGVRLVGHGAGGHTIFDRTEPAWYVLAGTVRRYRVEIPTAACRDLVSVEATLEADGVTAGAITQVSSEACRR